MDEKLFLAKVIYIVHPALFFLLPKASLITIVIAYIAIRSSPEWLASHYHFQIRTVWMGVLYFFVGSLIFLPKAFIELFFGFSAPFGSIVMGVLLMAWVVVRCVKGFRPVSRGEPGNKW